MVANVVIVEDEFLVALQLEDIVSGCGHRTMATVPDMAGLAAVQGRVDVAFVDLNLRDGLTGPRIAEMLSERFGARIIYVTANSAQIGDPASTALGVIHKPFSPEAIETALAYALDQTLAVPRPVELEALNAHDLRRSA